MKIKMFILFNRKIAHVFKKKMKLKQVGFFLNVYAISFMNLKFLKLKILRCFQTASSVLHLLCGAVKCFYFKHFQELNNKNMYIFNN